MTLALTLYRAAAACGEPFARSFLRRRLALDKEDATRIGERLGHPGLERPDKPLAWIHGASVGEGLAVLPLIERLTQRGMAVLLTTGTVTSAAVVAARLPEGAVHQFVPLDTPRAVRRFFDHWRPDLAILAESELWPNLMGEARRRGTPLALVNARMSPRSFARWRRLPRSIAAVLATVDLCLAQSASDASRLLALGAAEILVAGNMKFDAPVAPVDEGALTELRAALDGRPRWLAASTHAEEERLLLDAHASLAQHRADLLTILVPRHPERRDRIAALAAARGLTLARRSAAEAVTPGTAIYLADTMGELGLFYRLSPVAFVGKSLLAHEGGGQNPLEPARLGCAILHGPAVGNFEDVYAALDQAKGATAVQDCEALTAVVHGLLADPAAVTQMGRRARGVVEAGIGATDRTVEALAPILSRIGLGGST